ncbi:Formin Homology 2 Domain containing protein [Trichomonas vaginalis G3]|uniref:Formin Homology 2 Domain containing protein n=1 Tax=Trichomonas vaginalis (strain ATCC PRA-98 / G3) TaxID=412133 RepID=A2DXB4_TRIV3|nr:protein diaphanous-like protein [Trichomonas vaginalis G3]EAY14996.1 Formin Homology 2 Domain containing protein [Trichomonas vaginalis G3]KAI5507327.1 protein diaphanous-like protein [Trichomonas vaginalis G3]|eukprot:XP_001327219.1 Formin Homology 2 Domain containing protein [Trichomonas vaginalis G3]
MKSKGIPDYINASGSVDFEPFIAAPPPVKPTNKDGTVNKDEILKMFDETIKEMDLTGDQRKPLDIKPIEEKWNFIVAQQQINSQQPSPEYLTKLLKADNIVQSGKKERLSRILDRIAVFLKSSFLSWSTRFFKAKGHMILMSILTKKVATLNGFEPITQEDAECLINVLTCFRAICNTNSGIDIVMGFPSIFPLFVNSIYPTLPRTVELACEILLVIILSEQNLDKSEKNLSRILKSFKELKRSHHGWKIFTSIIKHEKENTSTNLLRSLITFIIGLYSELGEFPSLRSDWILEIVECGLFQQLQEIPEGRFQNLKELIQNIEEEMRILRTTFSLKVINPFNKKTLVKELYDMSDPNFLIPNISLSLFDVGIKNAQLFRQTSTFFYNVLTIIRCQNQGTNIQKLLQAIAIAKDVRSPIKLRQIKIEQDPTELFSLYKFLPESEMIDEPIMELVTEASGKIIDESKFNIESTDPATPVDTSSGDLHRIIADYESKLKAANQQIDGLRFSLRNAMKNKEQEVKKAKDATKKSKEYEKKLKVMESNSKEILNTANIYKNQADQYKKGVEAYKSQCEKIIQKFKDEIINLQSQNKELLANCKALQDVVELEKSQPGVKVSEEDVKSLKENKLLKHDLEMKEKENSELTKQNAELKDELEKLKKELSEAKNKIIEIESRPQTAPSSPQIVPSSPSSIMPTVNESAMPTPPSSPIQPPPPSPPPPAPISLPPGVPPPPPPPEGIPLPPGVPPPQGFGIPPPPGAPMGPPRKPNVAPPKKCRSIFWTKVPDAASVSMIWKQISDKGVKIDKEILMELFSPVEAKKVASGGKKRPKLVELLDPNRAKAISIMLGRLRRPAWDIVQQVKNLDDAVDEDLLASLKSTIPNDEEYKAVKQYNGDPNLLGTAENFVSEVMKVKLYQSHIEFLDLRMTFDEAFKDVLTPLTTLANGFSQLKTSKKFREFLAYILAIGNFLNGGTSRGGAYGFKFDFFTKILDIRTSRSGYTFLNYIAETFDVMDLINELPTVPSCLSVDFDTAKQNFQKLDQSFKKLDKAMEEAEKYVADGYMLYPYYMKFKEINENKLNNPPVLIKQIETDFVDVVKSYGEDTQKTKMVEFLEVFTNLITGLKNAYDENKARELAAQKAAERARKAEERARMKQGQKPVAPDGAERGVIDSLVQNMEKGNIVLKKKHESNVPEDTTPKVSELEKKMAQRRAKAEKSSDAKQSDSSKNNEKQSDAANNNKKTPEKNSDNVKPTDKKSDNVKSTDKKSDTVKGSVKGNEKISDSNNKNNATSEPNSIAPNNVSVTSRTGHHRRPRKSTNSVNLTDV